MKALDLSTNQWVLPYWDTFRVKVGVRFVGTLET